MLTTAARYSTSCCRELSAHSHSSWVPWENCEKLCGKTSPLLSSHAKRARGSQCFVVDFIFTYLLRLSKSNKTPKHFRFSLPSASSPPPVLCLHFFFALIFLPLVRSPRHRRRLEKKVWGLFCYCCSCCCFIFPLARVFFYCCSVLCVVPFTSSLSQHTGEGPTEFFFLKIFGSFLQLFMGLKHRRVSFVHDSRRDKKSVYYCAFHDCISWVVTDLVEIGKLIWRLEK